MTAYERGARDIIQHLRDQGIEITYHQQKAIDEFLEYASENAPSATHLQPTQENEDSEK